MSDNVPEIGPDGRPRPKYGEYATPEEQRARIAQPDASYALQAGYTPDAAASVAPAVPVAPAAPSGPQAARAVGAPHPMDRVATIALLVYGLVNVMFSVGSFLDLRSVATQALRLLGSDAEFTNVASAQLWGPIGAAVLVVGYLLTAWLSWRRLKAGKATWWLPLVGAVLTYAVVYVCLSVPLVGDPAFIDVVTSQR